MARKTIGPAAMSPASDRKWEARNALDTLRRAEEIKSDRGLMRDVKREAMSQQKALAKVTGRSSRKK